MNAECWGKNELALTRIRKSRLTQYFLLNCVFFLLLSEFKLKHFKNKPWYMACENTLHRSCDLTELGLHHLAIYTLRVRANLDGCHSDWVQKPFSPDKDGECSHGK